MAPASGDSPIRAFNHETNCENSKELLKSGTKMWNDIEGKYWESSAVVRRREDRELEGSHRTRQAEVSSRIYAVADEHHRLKLRIQSLENEWRALDEEFKRTNSRFEANQVS